MAGDRIFWGRGLRRVWYVVAALCIVAGAYWGGNLTLQRMPEDQPRWMVWAIGGALGGGIGLAISAILGALIALFFYLLRFFARGFRPN